MTQARGAILAGSVLLLAAAMPLAAAHLDSASGSPTSFGFGGLADPDPCRRQSIEGLGSGQGVSDLTGPAEDGPGATCTVNTAVSGTYVGTASAAAIECLGGSGGSGPDVGDLNDGDCDGVFLGPSAWGFQGATIADLETLGDCAGPVDTDEPTSDGNPDACGASFWLQPEGTWDDGGLGGAFHRSTYATAEWNTANSCSGRQAAEDWLLGEDVPIVVACDAGSSNFSPLCAVVAPLAHLDPGQPVQTVQDTAAAEADCARELVTITPKGQWTSCTPDARVDAGNLGKGGGHNGPGVLAPDSVDFTDPFGNPVTCTNGDLTVFVAPLVSANPFGEDVDDPENPHDDGLDEDDFAGPTGGGSAAQLDPTASDGGPGDKIVYTPAGGWIDGV